MGVCLKVNPFTTNVINKCQQFYGRNNELISITNLLYQTSKGNPKNIFISGYNGSGKSSLIKQIESIATGNMYHLRRIDKQLDKLYFDYAIGKNICADKVSIEDVIQPLINNLKNNLNRIPKFRVDETKIKFELNLPVAKVAVETTSKFGVVPIELVDKFADLIKNLSDKMCELDKSGIILIIDNLDNVIDGANYGVFFKALIEKIADKGVDNSIIILTGTKETLEKLIEQELSIMRLFEEIKISELTLGECKQLFENTLREINVEIHDDIINLVYNDSGGYPDIVQQLGHYMIEADIDNKIDKSDYDIAFEKVIKSKAIECEASLKKLDYRHKNILKVFLSSREEKIKQDYIIKQLSIKNKDEFISCIRKLTKLGFVKKEDEDYRIKNKVIRQCLTQYRFI